MNWAGPIIAILVAGQAFSPAWAQENCDKAVKGCERGNTVINGEKSIPKPRRKPTSSVATNPPSETRPPTLDWPPHGRSAGMPALACQSLLRSMGGEFSVPADLKTSGECQVFDPVQLTSLTTSVGTIEFPGRPILKCEFALQFFTWAGNIAAPVVAGLSNSKLVAISSGTGYECRNRYGDSSGKISEHAFGNAIDIDGLVLSNHRRIEISDAAISDHPDHDLLAALRTSACGYFTTVLGPGSNEAHESHFHFDLGKHGSSGKYRICE
jgi:hypothetical protein